MSAVECTRNYIHSKFPQTTPQDHISIATPSDPKILAMETCHEWMSISTRMIIIIALYSKEEWERYMWISHESMKDEWAYSYGGGLQTGGDTNKQMIHLPLRPSTSLFHGYSKLLLGRFIIVVLLRQEFLRALLVVAPVPVLLGGRVVVFAGKVVLAEAVHVVVLIVVVLRKASEAARRARGWAAATIA